MPDNPDAKKDKPKEAPASTSKDGYQSLGEIAGFIFILTLVAGFITNSEISTFFSKKSTDQKSEYSFPSSGNIQIGSRIYNKESVSIRRKPAGTIVGTQEKASYGIIKEGPVTLYGAQWWNVDYPNAPDGWVEKDFITSQMVLFFIANFFPALWGLIKVIAWWVIIILGILIGYVMVKTHQLDKKQNEGKEDAKKFPQEPGAPPVSASDIISGTIGGPPLDLPTMADILPKPAMDGRWIHITELIESTNQNDWRQAIIESDIILEEMLEKMGYHGDTIGEKLRNVEESDFTTLDKAWEAHKVRNRIAHSGSNFKLDHTEAKRIIGLFKEVFEEFYFI